MSHELALVEAPAGEPIADALAVLRATRDEIASRYVERDTEAELLTLCVLARVHLTLVGEPGNAKSQIVRDFCQAVEGARYFETLLAADSPAQRVLGPYSIPALDEGRFEFATTGMLPEAHLALLDEGYRANSTLLDNLLSVVNERVLHNGPQVVPCPLWSLVICCNQLPDAGDERTEAFRDRIAVTRVVRPVASDEGRRAIVESQLARRRGETGRRGAPATRDDVERAQEAVPHVALSEAFLTDALTLWRAGEEAGLPTSARRFGELAKLCPARALLDGRSECAREDLTLAQHVLWVDPDDQPAAYEVTLAFAGEWVRRAAELSKALSEYLPEVARVAERAQAVPADDDVPQELMQEALQLSRRIGALEQKATSSVAKAEADGADSREIARVRDEAAQAIARLRHAAFGMEP